MSYRHLGLAIWAVAGVAATLLDSIGRLTQRAVATLGELDAAWQWGVLLALAAAFAYLEGYRALHRQFAPAVVARSLAVADAGRAWQRVLAPLYAMSLIGDRPRALARAWLIVAVIAGSVVAVRALPEPWRGIVDAAVAVALAIGLGSIAWRFACAVRAPFAASVRRT